MTILSNLAVEISENIFPGNLTLQKNLEEDISEGRITIKLSGPDKLKLVFHNEIVYFQFLKNFRAPHSGQYDGELKGWIVNLKKEK